MRRSLEELKKDISFQATLRGTPFTFHTTWGLFSPLRVDGGSELLLEAMGEVSPDAVSLDIGCGYGALGLTLAKSAPQGKVHMVDKDFVAIEYAKKNAALNGIQNCEIYLSNGFSKVPEDIRFDLVVSNLPAKSERELYDIIFMEAKARFTPSGRLYVVTITGLREFVKKILKRYSATISR